MTSPPPPDAPEEHGFFHSFKGRLRRVKDSMKSPDSSSRGSGLLSPSSSSFRLLSRSRSTTPMPGARPLLRDSGERAPDPSPEPPAEVSLTITAIANPQKSPGNTAWSRLENSLRTLEKSTKSIPGINSALNALIGCLDVVQSAASNQEDYEQLAEELTSMANALNQYTGELGSGTSNTSIANIVQSIEDQIVGIQQEQERSTLGRFLDATRTQEDVMRSYRRIGKLFRQLQCQVTLKIGSGVQDQLETSLLRGMLPVDDARYNSSYSMTIKRRGCTPETREKIHKDLQDWVVDPDGAKVYWMSGMAGTGKTTIAYSLCEWLERTNRLGASFFCSRISSTCHSLSRIVPTLAYQFARYSPVFLSALCASLMDNRDAGTLNVVQQFEHLIQKPVLEAKDAIPDSVVLVIDALDECDDGYSVHLLLGVLLQVARLLPLKFFVASRPEYVILDRMMARGGTARSIMHLHDIEQSIVEEDIKTYLTDAFSSMSPPPSPKQIETLAKRAGKLFIYAATVVRYIHPKVIPVNSSARLEAMLKATRTGDGRTEDKYKELDRLYTTVLDAAFNEELGTEETNCMRRVLWAIICMKEPVTGDTIASLVNFSELRVWAALQSLRSVVHIPENGGLISALHASFPEFMLDQTRSRKFHCNESQSNEILAHRCFEIMGSELRFNICDLRSSYLMDDQVADLETWIMQCISPTLSYTCRYWGSHLQLAAPSDALEHMLKEFLLDRLLFWVEVLSLKHCVGIGVPMLHQVQTWLRIQGTQDEIQKRVADARNFVTWFAANPCSRSTPHIYISALPLCAKSSWVYQHYFQRTTGLPSISISQHDEAVLAIWSVESAVNSVAISPDGNRMASGSDDGSVGVYDMHTGAVVAGPFQGHTDMVWSVAFSPDGRHIASGSADNTVIVWDAFTGRIVTGPLKKHTSVVHSVDFSPDGRHLVSGSSDKTIIVWDTYTGAITLGPLEGHSEDIMSVAFSPDGRLIASSSLDLTIRLWDASTGAPIAEPLTGHTDRVYMVAFSPDGSKLASCSYDKTIRVWDVKGGTIVGLPFTGHKAGVWPIAFSHDGRWIASGGLDGDSTIIIWETVTGSVVLGPLSGHMEVVRSVGFTPDNTRIVSSSDDDTIRIWDVQPESRTLGQKNPRDLSVGPVAFLHDHPQLISSSSASSLKLWDIHTGVNIPREFEGQAEIETLYSIAVSPQDTLVAAGANDLSVRVWRILTGNPVCQPLRGHKGPVRCLGFSSDGAQLCSHRRSPQIIRWRIGRGHEWIARGHTSDIALHMRQIQPAVVTHSLMQLRFVRHGSLRGDTGFVLAFQYANISYLEMTCIHTPTTTGSLRLCGIDRERVGYY
ncbi:hypothetical protein ACGC1H_007430 [Rhizoctonia solani]